MSDHVCRGYTERAVAALAVVAALALAGCSSEAGFPAVHDMPVARAETPLTPDQVKQATDSLISQRDQLQTSALPPPAATAAAPQQKTAAVPAKPAKPAAKATAAASADDATGATAIGAYAKP